MAVKPVRGWVLVGLATEPHTVLWQTFSAIQADAERVCDTLNRRAGIIVHRLVRAELRVVREGE